MPANPLRIAAAAAELLAERRVADPLFQWEPTPPQGRFLRSEKGECWFIAANRSGKTDALAAWAASMLRFGRSDPKPAYSHGGRIEIRDRAVSLWMVSLTFPMSRDILQPKLFDNGYVPGGQPHLPFIPPHEIQHWSNTSQILRCKNGSIGGFKSADQGRDLFQGAGKDGVGFDEAPPFSIYNESVIRVEAGRRLYIRGACTLLPPEGVTGGVSWLFSEKINPWMRGDKRADLELIKASIYENPHILGRELERLEALYPVGSVDRRIRLQGEWLPQIAGSLAYASFHRGIHVNPKLTRDNVEFRHPLLLGIDCNVSPLAAVVGQQLGRKYRFVDEIFLETGSITDLGREFRRRFPNHGAELIVHGDATGTARTAQTARSDYELLMEELQGLPYPVSLAIPDKNPPVRDRINAANWILRGPGGEVRCEFAGHMVELQDDLEQVQHDKQGGIKKSHDNRDPYYRRTHVSDAWSYIIAYREPVTAGPIPTMFQGRRIPQPRYFR